MNDLGLNVADEDDFREYVMNCGYEIEDVSSRELQNLYEDWAEANGF